MNKLQLVDNNEGGYEIINRSLLDNAILNSIKRPKTISGYIR